MSEWKPKVGDEFWAVTPCGPEKRRAGFGPSAPKRGNMFPTREAAARAYCERLEAELAKWREVASTTKGATQ